MRHTRVFGPHRHRGECRVAHQLLQCVEVKLVCDREWLAGSSAQGVDAESARQG